jgi:hypothetical protein
MPTSKSKTTKGGRKAIGKEISRLAKKQGFTQKRAVAASLSMARAGKMGKGGKRAASKK